MKLNNSFFLVKLGLTKDAARCYECLLNNGSLNAQNIARELDILPNAVYRLVKKLQDKGFVAFLDTTPISFQAIPPKIAIEAYAEQKKKDFEEIKLESIASLSRNSKSAPQTKIDVVIGKNAFFSKFVELASTAKDEVLVISIGESVSDEVKLATRDLLERGVEVKIIFHKHDHENDQIVKSWKRMGVEVKHYPDWGYHLNLFDAKKSILVANNPENTEERTSMIIYSEGVSKALQSYFYSIWQKSVEIN